MELEFPVTHRFAYCDVGKSISYSRTFKLLLSSSFIIIISSGTVSISTRGTGNRVARP